MTAPSRAWHRVRYAAITVAIAIASIAGGCGSETPSTPTPKPGGAAASPTALPPPAPLTSSSPAAGQSDGSPVARPTDAVPPAATAPPAATGERVRVGNTDGQGANLRAEPSASAARIKGLRDGTELEVIGPERDAEGRRWRNVRDPSDGATGWIVSEFLVQGPPVSASPVAAPPAQPAASPAAAPAPAAPAGPAATAAPPQVASPAPATGPTGPARPTQRIDEADRAYLTSLQPAVDSLGKAIGAVNQQMELAGGRPGVLEDPTWRSTTEGIARQLGESAVRIRAATPGPNTREVHDHALKAADWADEAAGQLGALLSSRDARGFGAVRTSLLRVISEINAMNAALLQLQG